MSNQYLEVEGFSEKYFDEIFYKYKNKVFAYIYNVCKQKEDAEELVMDIFLNLWKTKKPAEGIENIENYLFTSARNKAIDYIRKISKSKDLQFENWENLVLMPVADADNRVSYNEAEHFVLKAIEKLPEQKKKIFILNYYHNLNNQQIADKLSLSVNTVKNQLSSSLKILRTHIKSDYIQIISKMIILLTVINF